MWAGVVVFEGVGVDEASREGEIARV